MHTITAQDERDHDQNHGQHDGQHDDQRGGSGPGQNVLGALRRLAPPGHVSFRQALKLADTQASHLLRHAHVRSWPTPTAITDAVHRLRVTYEHLPSSGMCFWDGRSWVICIARDEPTARQRFTIMHELKHIIDYGSDARLYRGHGRLSPAQQAERAADYFAGCLLMPKRLLRRAWRAGHRQPAALARLFEVSTRAVEVRLAQLGLVSEPVADLMAAPLASTAPQQLSLCPGADGPAEGGRP
jgi:hypothetical protein